MIPLFKVNMVDSAIKEVNKTLASGFIGQGPKVGEFELRLMEWINNDCIVTTNSATSGIHLSLHLLKKYFNDRRCFMQMKDAIPYLEKNDREQLTIIMEEII